MHGNVHLFPIREYYRKSCESEVLEDHYAAFDKFIEEDKPYLQGETVKCNVDVSQAESEV